MSQLQKLVAHQEDFQFLANGKIQCISTNHEIVPTVEAFQGYLNGKAYRRSQENKFDFAQYEPYLIQHKSKSDKMFCNLTRQIISKKKSSILKHVNGKRFKYYKQKYIEELEKEQRPEVSEDADLEAQLLDSDVEEKKPVQKKTIQKKAEKKVEKKVEKNVEKAPKAPKIQEAPTPKKQTKKKPLNISNDVPKTRKQIQKR